MKDSTTQYEWQQVLSVLSSHWIKPLLYFHIRRFASKLQPPEEILHQLRISFLASQSRVIQMEGQLAESGISVDTRS